MTFWLEKSLEELNPQQWEALCDGCARCCLVKLEDEDSGEICHTEVVCRHLDLDSCRCSAYPQRHQLVPDCIDFTAGVARQLRWLPTTCAYRLVAEGKDLPEWHPLRSGSADSVHEAGISVRGKVVSEEGVHDDALADMIIHWVEI